MSGDPSASGSGGGRPRRRASFGRMIRVIVGWTLGWWALLALVIHPVIPGGAWTLAAVAAVELVIPLAVFARAMSGRLYPGAATRLLVFRPFWYLQLAVPVLAAAGALGVAAGLVGVVAGLPWSVALMAGRYAVGGMALAIGALLVAGWVGSRLLRTRTVEVSLPGLPAPFDGVRIVQASDLHVGPHTSRRHMARVAEAIRSARPDVIVFTGDQVDDYARDTEPFARAFADLDAPLGVFSIAGNHDVYAGWAEVRRGLEAAGHRVLVNEAVPLRRDGATLWLAGTGDPAGRAFPEADGPDPAPDLDRTLAAVPADGLVVALAHNPVLWPDLVERGVPLTLSGHTHHGQLSVPKLDWSLASVFLEHAMGRYERDTSVLYINPGTNYWGLPFRIGALPEVTVVVLRRPSG